MNLPPEVLILGGLAVMGVAGVLIAFAVRTRQVDSASSSASEAHPAGAGPSARRAAAVRRPPRREKVSPARQRERLAAAFAEQIEGVLRATLLEDPLLADSNVDLATAPDGSLEIIVDGETYSEISDIPDRRVREALVKAVEEWQAGTWQEEGKR
jgi:hypothetical protein